MSSALSNKKEVDTIHLCIKEQINLHQGYEDIIKLHNNSYLTIYVVNDEINF